MAEPWPFPSGFTVEQSAAPDLLTVDSASCGVSWLGKVSGNWLTSAASVGPAMLPARRSPLRGSSDLLPAASRTGRVRPRNLRRFRRRAGLLHCHRRSRRTRWVDGRVCRVLGGPGKPWLDTNSAVQSTRPGRESVMRRGGHVPGSDPIWPAAEAVDCAGVVQAAKAAETSTYTTTRYLARLSPLP
jgi:hypothetical protein